MPRLSKQLDLSSDLFEERSPALVSQAQFEVKAGECQVLVWAKGLVKAGVQGQAQVTVQGRVQVTARVQVEAMVQGQVQAKGLVVSP